jgi:WD40 repeat protein
MSDHPDIPTDTSDQAGTFETVSQEESTVSTMATSTTDPEPEVSENLTSSEVPVEVNEVLLNDSNRIEETENPVSLYQDSRELDQEQTIPEQGHDGVISDYSETFSFSKLKPDFQPELFGQVSFDTYTRGCKWSPDGLCILTLSDDNRLKIFDTPSHEVDSTTAQVSLQAAVTMKEAETVYDFQWYPLMDSNKPETCCLATTSQYQPIHLYDAFDGHLRATYR